MRRLFINLHNKKIKKPKYSRTLALSAKFVKLSKCELRNDINSPEENRKNVGLAGRRWR